MVKEIKHYIEKVLDKFPYLSLSEIIRILTFGLRRYAYVNRMHCDVLFQNYNDEVMTIHCGALNVDSLKHYLHFVTRQRMRERMISKFKKEPWDGYYFIGLTEELHLKIKKLNRYKHFENIYPTKLIRELYHLPFVKHIWRIPYIEDCGFRFFLPKLKTDQAEYIGENQYGKYHQCFLEGSRNGSTSSDSEQRNNV